MNGATCYSVPPIDVFGEVANMTDHVTAQEWFSSGTRVPYDPVSKKILGAAERANDADPIQVFERVARGDGGHDNQSTWTTFLPGFPDGSFGWAKIDQHLSNDGMAPKIHVEYVGQGDSDKPSKYPYGTMERADLVEAIWEAEGIRSTFIV